MAALREVRVFRGVALGIFVAASVPATLLLGAHPWALAIAEAVGLSTTLLFAQLGGTFLHRHGDGHAIWLGPASTVGVWISCCVAIALWLQSADLPPNDASGLAVAFWLTLPGVGPLVLIVGGLAGVTIGVMSAPKKT